MTEEKNRCENAAVQRRVERALEEIASGRADRLPDGRTNIDSDALYVNVFDSRPSKEAKVWEAHRRYIDVQYIISGGEDIGLAPLETLEPSGDYDAQNDVIVGSAQGELRHVAAGEYLVIRPDTAHCPGIFDGEHREGRKAVFKVLCAD